MRVDLPAQRVEPGHSGFLFQPLGLNGGFAPLQQKRTAVLKQRQQHRDHQRKHKILPHRRRKHHAGGLVKIHRPENQVHQKNRHQRHQQRHRDGEQEPLHRRGAPRHEPVEPRHGAVVGKPQRARVGQGNEEINQQLVLIGPVDEQGHGHRNGQQRQHQAEPAGHEQAGGGPKRSVIHRSKVNRK
ncbi:hypothetical protein [Hymenobacter lapidarius]|uniref:hypothetical protein n=1 Tax=Hymenobacter lapidarius TaxID=1908237 RepID=UPI0008A538B8|nr:hypothetical protein [Hymenobacter lapidarius]